MTYLVDEAWPVRLALDSIAGRYDEVRGFDGEAKTLFPQLPDAFNTPETMEPGHGYLIHMSQAATLGYPDDDPGKAVDTLSG